MGKHGVALSEPSSGNGKETPTVHCAWLTARAHQHWKEAPFLPVHVCQGRRDSTFPDLKTSHPRKNKNKKRPQDASPIFLTIPSPSPSPNLHPLDHPSSTKAELPSPASQFPVSSFEFQLQFHPGAPRPDLAGATDPDRHRNTHSVSRPSISRLSAPRVFLELAKQPFCPLPSQSTTLSASRCLPPHTPATPTTPARSRPPPLPSRSPRSIASNVAPSHWPARIRTSRHPAPAHSPGYPRKRILAPLVDAVTPRPVAQTSRPSQLVAWPVPPTFALPASRIPPSSPPRDLSSAVLPAVLPLTLLLPKCCCPALSRR